MWYEIRWMRALFYIGAMLALIGVGLIYMDQRVAGAVLLCVGIACIIIGFMGIRLHLAVNKNGRRR